MTWRLTPAATAVLAALLLAACGSAGSHPAAAHTAAASPAAAPSSAAPSPSLTPTPAPARLTIRQAARAYTEIVDPFNRTADAVNRDETDRAAMAQFRADARAYGAAERTMVATLSAVRWPARVAPYVHAMLSTDIAADLRCFRKLQAARSYNQVNAISFNQDCTAAANTSNADTIRSLLHLPSLGG